MDGTLIIVSFSGQSGQILNGIVAVIVVVVE